MPYKSALLVLALAIVPLLYVNSWLGIAAAIAAYAIAARLANREMDRVFLIEKLKAEARPGGWHRRTARGVDP